MSRIEAIPVLGGVEITVGGVTLRLSFSDFSELFLAMQETRQHLAPRLISRTAYPQKPDHAPA